MKPKHNKRCNIDSESLDDYAVLKGVNLFKNQLEKFFFADVDIKIIERKLSSNSYLIINLNCNFGLTESLFHLNNGNWGGFCKNSSELEYSGFELAVFDLQQKNASTVVIEEIAIHFKDTSLIITKIPEQDITDQLCDILNNVSENFVHFTRGLTEMPYEIFIPVFEEKATLGINLSLNNNLSYFNYWGIYFQSELSQDALVYDLSHKTIINGDFSLLNKGE